MKQEHNREGNSRDQLVSRRTAVATALTVTLVGALTACTDDAAPKPAAARPRSTTKPPVKAAPSPTPTPTINPPVIQPLTGRVAAPPPHAAVIIKVENSIESRPQTGLQAADIVYHEEVEGGITRLIAVYHSTLPLVVGPVRSVRPTDADIIAPLKGLFAYSGGQARFITMAGAVAQLFDEDSGGNAFVRHRDRRAPHNLYVTPAQLVARANQAHKAPPVAQFAYAPDTAKSSAVLKGVPSAGCTARYSPGSVSGWSAAPNGWQHNERGVPFALTEGGTLTATNVVVLSGEKSNYRGASDPAGNPVPHTQYRGSGSATVFTAGHTISGTWHKATPSAVFELKATDGSPILLAPGNTFVELLPRSTGTLTLL